MRRFVLAPAVVAAARDREHLAHERDGKHAAFGVDPSIRRIPPTSVSHSSANQEAAFFKKATYRSRYTIRFWNSRSRPERVSPSSSSGRRSPTQ